MSQGAHGGPGPSPFLSFPLGCLLTLPIPIQVHIPSRFRGPSEEMRTRREAWLESLAAFMASQPASSQINLAAIPSSGLRAAQVLAPWISSLSVNVNIEDDIGKILKGAIEVGQRSSTWRCPPCVLKQEVEEPPHILAHSPHLISTSTPCSQAFPRLRDLVVYSMSEEFELHPFTSVEWPEAGEHYPAMDTLRSLILGGSDVLLLPPSIDLRKFSSLRRLMLLGGMYAKGEEAQRQQVFKLQPHVTVTYEDNK
jgi:hypothetical protein